MDKEFIESLIGMSEDDIVAKLKEEGYIRCDVQFQMGDSARSGVSPVVLPMGIEKHRDILILDYSVLRPNQYEPHECYAFFWKPSI